MACARFSLFLTILFSIVCVLFADKNDNVPVLLWPKSGDTRLIGSLAEYKTEDFKNLLAQQIKPDTTLIVFLSDVLNTNLISCRTENQVTCFPEVSEIKGKWYIPSVEGPSAAINDLFQKDLATTAYVNNEGDLSEKIQTGSKQVVFAKLPPTPLGETAEAYLGRCDRIIAKIIGEYAKDDKVAFMYTGVHSGIAHSRKARSAAPALSETASANEKQSGPPSTDPTFFKNNNFLIYYTGLYELTSKKESKVISINTLSVSDVTASSLTVELAGDRSIKLVVQNGGGYWGITQGSIDGHQFLTQTLVGASLGFSYHCSPPITFKVNHTDTVSVTITGLQLEPKFGTAGNPLVRYSPAQDCVGFTSAGIWAGLFVVIMLLFIMTIGITWIMDIRTMDRFDDPKGKTITIGNAE